MQVMGNHRVLAEDIPGRSDPATDRDVPPSGPEGIDTQPTLELTQDFELASYSRDGMIWGKVMLEKGPRPTVYRK
jgi:hypothetical protein